MSLIFDYAASGGRSDDKDDGLENKYCRASLELDHKRLWQDLRERLQFNGAGLDLEGLKLLKSYADILLVITKTERLIWDMEEKAPGREVYGEDEIAEAMAQITFSQRAGKAAGGE